MVRYSMGNLIHGTVVSPGVSFFGPKFVPIIEFNVLATQVIYCRPPPDKLLLSMALDLYVLCFPKEWGIRGSP